ncbi:Oidioi.mRNA.OKI2018_I69.PAR.g8829.t1.cds [Oikopleura dioica]|uniref:Oidioi.mRNA.OKI2018_I69.PAR.g8829.t1.cds n=1 Tax=Oikopleura dioica TaxID=34765 RepID=A0ABN7RLV2_OIKDI|nr:Oidioi.mRNA.OKI2018_I69.PAR.g8829.t1.cds [Oikopleura dioica]
MKIAATLAAFASAAEWQGQNDVQTCGAVASVDAGDSPVNATCTISFGGYATSFVSVGGVFWTSDSTFTSFEGIFEGSTVEVLAFFPQSYDADGNLDNSTCGTEADISVSCVDQGAAEGRANLIGNFAFAPDNNNFQVPVANADDSFAVDLSSFGAVQNQTCNGDAMSTSGSSLSCAFGDVAQISYFGFSSDAQPANPNSLFA